MPKVVYGEQNRCNAALWEYIHGIIGKRDPYRSRKDFAEQAMRVSKGTFSHWEEREEFPGFYEALCNLFRNTHITDRRLCHIFGIEYKGRTKKDERLYTAG